MRALFTSIAVAALLTATGATAQPVDDGFVVSISYADLNLSHPAGQAALDARIKARAGELCDADTDSPLQQSLANKKCRAHFIRSAERELELQFTSAPVSGNLFASR